MTDELFCKLWKDALAQPDQELYIAEYGYPDWFDEISEDTDKIVGILGNIHSVAHMGIKDILSASGLTQRAFATKFCIPIRTVEDWAAGRRKCADYGRLAYAKLLGMLSNY